MMELVECAPLNASLQAGPQGATTGGSGQGCRPPMEAFM